MTLPPFRRRPRFVAMLALLLFGACGKKPITTVGAVAGCGPLPPKVMLCLETLPRLPDGEVDQTKVTQADLKRCYKNTVTQLIAEVESLRVRYGPCAK